MRLDPGLHRGGLGGRGGGERADHGRRRVRGVLEDHRAGVGARILGALFAAAGASLDPDMADRPLSGDLEAARLLLFDDALWMAAEPSTDA